MLNMVIIYLKIDFLQCTYCYFHLSLSFNINNMPKETSRKRKSLTAAQKKRDLLKENIYSFFKTEGHSKRIRRQRRNGERYSERERPMAHNR